MAIRIRSLKTTYLVPSYAQRTIVLLGISYSFKAGSGFDQRAVTGGQAT